MKALVKTSEAIGFEYKDVDVPKIGPKDVLVKEGRKLKAVHPERCNLCDSCVEMCEVDAIKVTGDPTKIVFRFETDGSMAAKDVLLKGLSILEEQFEHLREQVSSLE